MPRLSTSVAAAWLLLLSLAAPLRAQSQPTITVSKAVRLRGTIHLDGKLDEPAWATAPVTDGFTQIDPQEGQPASERTEVRVLYDDAALYVGVRLHQEHAKIIGRLGRRDGPLGDSDWFGVMIDSYHDHRTAFGFDVNPLGVRRDEVKTINTDDGSWDAVWDVATSVGANEWIAEYRIPFSQLRFSADSAQTWGVQFERIIGSRGEYAVSTFIPKRDQGGVPRYGHLEGLTGLQSGKKLELLPYTVQRASYVDPGLNPFKTRNEYETSAGLDLRYRMTSNLTLNATINPDFGQVEVDPAVVNLGVYETFYQEKRPFFIEGNEIFDFGANGTSGGQLFYSRRIGRAPTLPPPVPTADVPDVTTILAAAKMTGKQAGWSVGLLEAVTGKEEARFRSPTVSDGRALVEPLANYVATRARREMRGGQTILGGIFTAVNRDLGADTSFERRTLRSSAFAGGVDFRHEWNNRNWVLYGDAEVSRVAGSASAIALTQRQSNHFFQRPDATHLGVDSTATSLTGYSINAALARQAGEHWLGTIAGALTSPKYEVNDIGFAQRTDRKDGQVSVTYQELTPSRYIRRWSTSVTGRSEHNYDFQPILAFGSVATYAQFTDFSMVHLFAQRYFQAYDDRLTRGGPLAVRPSWWLYNAYYASDARRPLTLELQVNADRYDYGSHDLTLSTGVFLKSSTWWNLRVTPTLYRARFANQFVGRVADSTYAATYGQRYVFAPLKQTQISLETRFNATFSPRLSLETYAQPLLSSADYGSAKQFVAPRTYLFAPYGGSVPNLDFNLRSLRGTAVLRWEWREGSTMYLAWQQRREDFAQGIGDFDLNRDRRALFGTRPDNVFILKINYWLNP